MPATDFNYTDQANPHYQRASTILAAHPEIRELLGRKNPHTMVWIVCLCLVQVFLAAWLRNSSIQVVLSVAYLVGAVLTHSLFVCIHEAAHNLIFRTSRANMLAGYLANLPSLIPTAMSFRHYHLKHHSFMGLEDQDVDLPCGWEARLIGSYFPGKVLWLALFPIFQVLRTRRVTNAKSLPPTIQLNWLTQALFVSWIYWCWGPIAIVYLLASIWFSVGLHPLGARWVQEHWLVLDGQQETTSYYGPLNWINLNVGYHNEHHDFPSVPWNLLPEVKRRAPEVYDSLYSHHSLTGLYLRFLFDQEINLFCRIVRRPQAGTRTRDHKGAVQK